MRDNLELVYRSLDLIDAPEELYTSLCILITYLYENDYFVESFNEQHMPPEELDDLHESLDDLLTQEKYDQQMAEYYISREEETYGIEEAD